MTNNEHKAQLAFTAARAEQEKIVQPQRDYGPAWCVLGIIDAALGRKEEAVREGRRAFELVPMSKDAVLGVELITQLATIYAWIGEKDLTHEQLASPHKPVWCALRRVETGSSMGLASRRSTLRKNCRLARTKGTSFEVGLLPKIFSSAGRTRTGL
jgi:hypothetical protein